MNEAVRFLLVQTSSTRHLFLPTLSQHFVLQNGTISLGNVPGNEEEEKEMSCGRAKSRLEMDDEIVADESH